MGMGWELSALILGTPVLLMGLMLLLARFEDAAVEPGERAAKVAELLSSGKPPEDVEQATAKILEACTPAPPRTPDRQDAA